MRKSASILALPASLLALVNRCNADLLDQQRWPYNLPYTAKYYPGDEDSVISDRKAQEKIVGQTPIGLRKLSSDEGEKFWPRYWSFNDDWDDQYGSNSTSVRAPFARHWNSHNHQGILRRGLFQRDFECPAGTSACNADSQACCSDGDTCITTNSGAVGCCAAGSSCDGDSIGICDIASGYTPCEAAGGGCCSPGASCVYGGCLFSGTETVTTTLPVVTVTTGQPLSTSSSTVSTDSPVSGASISSTPTTTTTTVLSFTGAPLPLTCSSGFSSCPESQGGGCCRTGYACGSVLCECTSGCSSSTSSATTTADAPIAPTSVDSTTTSVSSMSTTTTTTTPSTSTTYEGCPTGFYVCSAYYMGGCCRVGRNCDTTSCPSSESTAIISNPTVIVPATTDTEVGATGNQGSCANGWYSCPADASGGCCPSGYVCGTATCTAMVSGAGDTPKRLPNAANVQAWVCSFFVSSICFGIAMIVL